MSAVAYTEERQRDDLCLRVLSLWEDGWSAGDIGKDVGVSRNAALGIIHRIHHADPTALKRKPQLAAHARCPS